MGLIHDKNMKGAYQSPKYISRFGTKDYFKSYKENRGTVSRGAFFRIMRKMNKAVVEEILETGEEYNLPHGIGTIYFIKKKNKAIVVDGKVILTAPVDWHSTMKLWEDNEEARDKKVLVRHSNMHTSRYSFRIRCTRMKIKNKKFFKFTIMRSFKRAYAQRIKTYDKDKLDIYKID